MVRLSYANMNPGVFLTPGSALLELVEGLLSPSGVYRLKANLALAQHSSG